MREPQRERRSPPPLALAAPRASSRPFPRPDPSPQSPSSVTSLYVCYLEYRCGRSALFPKACSNGASSALRLRTGLVYVEGDREGETEEHFSPTLRGVVAMVEGLGGKRATY